MTVSRVKLPDHELKALAIEFAACLPPPPCGCHLEKRMQTPQNTLGGLTAATLAKPLPDMGDALGAQLATLQADPTPERCEKVAIQLDGVRMHVNRLRHALLIEREG